MRLHAANAAVGLGPVAQRTERNGGRIDQAQQGLAVAAGPAIDVLCEQLEGLGEDGGGPALIGVGEGRARQGCAAQVVVMLAVGVPAGLQRAKAVEAAQLGVDQRAYHAKPSPMGSLSKSTRERFSSPTLLSFAVPERRTTRSSQAIRPSSSRSSRPALQRSITGASSAAISRCRASSIISFLTPCAESPSTTSAGRARRSRRSCWRTASQSSIRPALRSPSRRFSPRPRPRSGIAVRPERRTDR